MSSSMPLPLPLPGPVSVLAPPCTIPLAPIVFIVAVVVRPRVTPVGLEAPEQAHKRWEMEVELYPVGQLVRLGVRRQRERKVR